MTQQLDESLIHTRLRSGFNDFIYRPYRYYRMILSTNTRSGKKRNGTTKFGKPKVAVYLPRRVPYFAPIFGTSGMSCRTKSLVWCCFLQPRDTTTKSLFSGAQEKDVRDDLIGRLDLIDPLFNYVHGRVAP